MEVTEIKARKLETSLTEQALARQRQEEPVTPPPGHAEELWGMLEPGASVDLGLGRAQLGGLADLDRTGKAGSDPNLGELTPAEAMLAAVQGGRERIAQGRMRTAEFYRQHGGGQPEEQGKGEKRNPEELGAKGPEGSLGKASQTSVGVFLESEEEEDHEVGLQLDRGAQQSPGDKKQRLGFLERLAAHHTAQIVYLQGEGKVGWEQQIAHQRMRLRQVQEMMQQQEQQQKQSEAGLSSKASGSEGPHPSKGKEE